jgi:hypothetical protein
MASRTTEYYRKNPKARAKKNAYNKKRNKRVSKKFRVKSHLTGKMIRPNSDNQNRLRSARKKGQDTSKTDYDHSTKKRICKSKNRGNKKHFVFRLKKKRKK